MGVERMRLPVARAMALSAEAAATDGRITAAIFRDRAGIGRNLAIELLELFDRTRFTRRVGDAHEVLRPASAAFGDAVDPGYRDAAPDGRESHPGGAPGLQTR